MRIVVIASFLPFFLRSKLATMSFVMIFEYKTKMLEYEVRVKAGQHNRKSKVEGFESKLELRDALDLNFGNIKVKAARKAPRLI